MNRRTFLGAVLSGITVLALSACGASATPAEGTGSQALPPIMIEIGGESIVGDAPSTIKASDFVVFTGESSGWTVATTTPDIVSVVQGGTQDTYQTNPGFEAIKAGTAVVTITSPMGTVITLDITVE